MRFPSIRLPLLVAALVVLFSVLVAPPFLFFGFVELIHPDVPEPYRFLNTVVCLAMVCLGGVLPFLAVAVYLGSIRSGRPSA